MKLLTDTELEQSSVVANCCMNRERGLRGVNSYAKELRFDPLEYVSDVARNRGQATWLDLCCGTAAALADAAEIVDAGNLPIRIIGIDLAGLFVESTTACLRLTQASLRDWTPGEAFDLITCVHGLHYVGDKLGLIMRAASWLTPDGRLAANLDANNLKLEGDTTSRAIVAALRDAGFRYSARHNVLESTGPRNARLQLGYLGANDAAGPNYTGQPAVDSHYRR